ncbi:hypothetical protein HDU97_002037 [Phlyctochytrium planicorne]|nr:hypothetical protein HDU97_002037 [Phlyctochytrium planicorne]
MTSLKSPSNATIGNRSRKPTVNSVMEKVGFSDDVEAGLDSQLTHFDDGFKVAGVAPSAEARGERSAGEVVSARRKSGGSVEEIVAAGLKSHVSFSCQVGEENAIELDECSLPKKNSQKREDKGNGKDDKKGKSKSKNVQQPLTTRSPQRGIVPKNLRTDNCLICLEEWVIGEMTASPCCRKPFK